MGKFLLVVALVALVVYVTVRVIERRGIKPAPRRPEPRPLGPDDDPDFLWNLDRKKRHAKPQSSSTPQPEPKPKPESKSQPHSDPKPDPQPESKSQPESTSQPEDPDGPSEVA